MDDGHDAVTVNRVRKIVSSWFAFSKALPAPCLGAFYALKDDGTAVTFAVTAAKLYRLAENEWVEVADL